MDDPQINTIGEETAIQKQARIRRERREAKIKSGGSARLDKITSLSGRIAEPTPSSVPSSSSTTSVPQSSTTDPSTDPDEVDISNHPYTSSRSSSHSRTDELLTEADIRRLLRSGAPPPDGFFENSFGRGFSPGQLPPPAGASNTNGNEDAMMGLLQQMMGGGMPGGGGPGGADTGGSPPGLAAMLGAGAGGAGPGLEQQALDRHAYLWKVVHALLALALGVYIATVTAFSGARVRRKDDNGNRGVDEASELGIRFQFFWAFATAELGLQSARFFLNRGRVKHAASGWLGFLVHALPQPWAAWVALAGQYAAIYTTVVQDAMVVVFVLGVVAWWRGDVSG